MKTTVVFTLEAKSAFAAVVWADQMAEDTDHHPDVDETDHRVLDPATGWEADKRGQWTPKIVGGFVRSRAWLDAYDYGYVAGKHGIFTSNPFSAFSESTQDLHEGWANGYVQGSNDRAEAEREQHDYDLECRADAASF
jgi:hypothetical protein